MTLHSDSPFEARGTLTEVLAAAAPWVAARLAGLRVAVAVPDLTRPVDHAALEPLFAQLFAAGAEVTVVVALGLHRVLSSAELAPLATVAERHGARLLQSDASDDANLATLDDRVEVEAGRLGARLRSGAIDEVIPARLDDHVDLDGERPGRFLASEASNGVRPTPSGPVEIEGAPVVARFHRAVVEADAVLCVGWVEPHQYAGFSGGVKTVAIGCAAAATISALHGLPLLRHPGTALGRVEGNPFQDALWRLTVALPLVWAVQVVSVGPQVALFAGPARAAFSSACEVAARSSFVEVAEPYDWLHLGVPASKGASFYQASRAATYVALVDRPAVREGATLLLEAPCPEGLGLGAGERAFALALSRGRAALLAELASSDRPLSGGEQRAFVLAKALERVQLVVVGAPAMPELAAIGVRQVSSLAEARATLDPSGRGAYLPDVFHGIPRAPAAPGGGQV